MSHSIQTVIQILFPISCQLAQAIGVAMRTRIHQIVVHMLRILAFTSNSLRITNTICFLRFGTLCCYVHVHIHTRTFYTNNHDSHRRDGKGFDYIENDTVTDGGISGVYGESSMFIPKYIYDEHPEWTLLTELKSNDSLRQLLIASYTINSDTNWISKWWEIWGDKLDEYPFKIPQNDTPIIFGSLIEYATSKYTNELVGNLLGDGINWTFAAFGTESVLTEFVIDLYSKHLPFIANLYSPHADFATTLPNATEYMQFERVALPRNPNNNVDAVCYENGQCSFPINPLLKIGNPKLFEEFDEMHGFLLDFDMSTNDVNDIIAYYAESEAYNLSKHDTWINATCKWLKNNEDATQIWYQEITRYDCIFESGSTVRSNCGFNYFYETVQDAVNGENQKGIPWYDSVAGSCENATRGPQCDCVSEYFVGDTCRYSCPGVVGPVLNGELEDAFRNDSVVKVGNYTF